MSFRSGGSGGPMTLSQVPGSPSFRSSAVNAVAVIPLLSSDRSGQDDTNTASSKSFNDLLDALNRYNKQATGVGQSGDELLLVVPNTNLTRPGDWKYDNTPLKNFHWGHGCQRLTFFDGRPYNSRMAHDRLINHELTRNWIDLCPSRRTAALIGVLNVRDCPDMATLKRAEQEWRQWAERYSTPPYEVSAHGRDFERDFVVQRLFVFDSFHESNKVDVSQTSLGSSLVAFPPSDDEHTQMMDVHMNVVINDLAVAIFQELEGRIRESDAITKGTDGQPLSSAAAKSRFSSLLGTGTTDTSKEERPQGSTNLSINNLASVVSPDSSLATPTGSNKDPRQLTRTESTRTKLTVSTKGSSSEAQLLTPLDDVWDFAELSPKDAHEMMRREVGRREKYAGDLALLAGSPLDAYERYMKAADLCKTSCPDPLWYASALEGCAAAHVAMAEAGGFNVEEYLESSFQLPDEMMASAILPSGERANKQNMSSILSALCDDALNITSRHPNLACFRAELLLKLAWYSAEVEDVQQRCLWGMGEGCYGGEAGSDQKRWEMPSATQLNFLDLKNKKGEDIVKRNTIQRCQKWSEVMHKAVATGELDPVTRADVALRCASLCLKGLRPTNKPTSRERSESRMQFRRKAAFFAVAAAESLSELDEDTDDRTSAMWVQASKLLSQNGNTLEVGSYGWATLRAVALHGLATQGLREASEVAAVDLLSLMSEISPKKPSNNDPAAFFAKAEEEYDDGNDDRSIRSDGERSFGPTTAESVVSAARIARSAVKDARTYVQEVRTKRPSFFSGLNVSSTALLAVAQSKWVEDDEISPILLPMSDLSEISNSIIAMRSVWSAIKFQNCVNAQKKVIEQISDLRQSMPASTIPSQASEGKSSFLPIKITSISILDSEGDSSLERVKTKSKSKAENQGAMATFFNPYADKKGEAEAVLLPEGEERYISVRFANRLAVPLEIPRCQLEFTVEHNDQIKAPAISFVIPGETDDFSVQFPFMVLSATGDVARSEDPIIYEVKGLHVTCLGRGFFLPVGSDDNAKEGSGGDLNIPAPASHYPRRKYNQDRIRSGEDVKSPRLEVVPAQPNLLLSFAAASTPMEDGIVIPAPIADGEVYDLPKLVLSNELGFDGMGMIKELQIIALGLQGYPKLVLFDLNEDASKGKMQVEEKKEEKDAPLTLTAKCDNVDFDCLNKKSDGARVSSISFQLSAAANMGTLFKGGSVTIRFRYRGDVPSSNLQVWRKREVLIGIVRTKGPRISSLTFRPDLSWESAYSSLCKSVAHEEKNKRYSHNKSSGKDNSSQGTTEDEDFVSHRLGKDPGVHVCGDKVVAMVTVANETSSAIVLSKSNENVGGFEGIPIETMRVEPGVSAKIPMILQRIDRTPELSGHLVEITKLQWTSDTMSSAGDGLTTETGGTMVPLNMRVRKGCIQIPTECLKSIVDENKTLLSRICKAPVAVDVGIIGGDGNSSNTIHPVKQGVPVDISVQIEVAEWVPDDLLKDFDFRLKFCCAPKDSSRVGMRRDFVWSGQIRKSLDLTERHNHRARLIFLNEGDYVISACVSISRAHSEDDGIKETWWAERAQRVQVRATG